jgi:transposase InsO family protein
VTSFCLEQGISRKTFYEIRKRAIVEGPAAALEPRSRRPKRSPTTVDAAVVQDALRVRAALEQSGLDHGPISVHDRMRALGLEPVPSTAALARIFRTAGVARLEPRKRPRASYRRFVYPAPNACWQLDATQYVLSGGRTCVIFQLIDDHSRLAIASHAARAETAEGALEVVKKGIAAHGVPQRLLSDNGVALNPARRGIIGQLVAYATSLGIEPITGRPYHPTTQGKNERFHQTLFRYLDKQPLADTIAQLQAQIDAFDLIYNTQRPHQALPGRTTPQQAWDATARTEPPRPAQQPAPIPPLLPTTAARLDRAPVTPRPGVRALLIHSSGNVKVRRIQFHIDSRLAGHTVYVIENADTVTFTDVDGNVLLERPWPAPGITYVSNGHPRGPRLPLPPQSPMS